MPRRTDLNHVLVIGSGPIIIGQACEFDYSGSQAAGSLREEWVKVILINLGEADFVIRRGDRIAQLVIAPVASATWLEVERLEATDRGAGGFGSTGAA